MYKRDLAVVLLSLFAIWWSLQSEGTYHFYKAFYHDLPADRRLIEEQHPLPPPIVVRSAQHATCNLQQHLLGCIFTVDSWQSAVPSLVGVHAWHSCMLCPSHTALVQHTVVLQSAPIASAPFSDYFT